jgi:hypothetical protein
VRLAERGTTIQPHCLGIEITGDVPAPLINGVYPPPVLNFAPVPEKQKSLRTRWDFVSNPEINLRLFIKLP